MTSQELRTAYLEYFKQRGHVCIPSAPLIPENDPTTLFTGSGMQPLIPYLLGEKHPMGSRLVDSQKCFRAEDIEEVGDNRHSTFFEMLGNWSLGDYFKREQLRWFFEFLVDEVGLNPERLYVSAFAGDSAYGIPRDTEAADIWKELFREKGIEAHDIVLGTEAAGYESGMQGGRIFYYDAKKNWWSRSGVPAAMPAGEPGGPDSEVFYEFTDVVHNPDFGTHCHPNCDCGRYMEVGNSVFMEYRKRDDGAFEKLPQRNVDFGGGLERIAAASANNPDIFRAVDTLAVTVRFLEELAGRRYEEDGITVPMRIVSDHMRGAVFMIGDGVLPSNTDAGYVLRRLIRRAIRYADVLGIEAGSLCEVGTRIAAAYADSYPNVAGDAERITRVLKEEEAKFRKTLERGMKELEKLHGDRVSGEAAFVLFTTYGFPVELTEEIVRQRGMSVDRDAYDARMQEHRDLSRTSSEGRFKGGLADASERTTMLHTCTHLLLAGLRKYLGDSVHQAGSNITEERTRFDFSHGEKVPADVLAKVEAYVNDAIERGCTVSVEVMDKSDAQHRGVEGSFWDKYPDSVTVYSVVADDGTVYSQELCGGPHVAATGTIKGRFKILKEEASAAGVRRIKATLLE